MGRGSDGWCRHYNGIMTRDITRRETCKAGVRYDSVEVKQERGLSKYPCTKGAGSCPSYEPHTPEEIAAEEERFRRVMNNLSPCCGEPVDESQVIKSGRYKGSGMRYCPKCKQPAFRACAGVGE